MFPSHCKEVSLKNVDFELTAENIKAFLKGKSAYIRTRYFIFNWGSDWAVALVVKKQANEVLQEISSVHVLTLPEDTSFLEDPSLDVLSASSMGALRERMGTKCVVVKGRAEHVSFFVDEPPYQVTVFDVVPHKLAAYTWNVIENYETEFVVTVHEGGLDWRLTSARFSSRDRFGREPLGERQLERGVLVDSPVFRIRAEFLDHGTPCLALAFDEAFHINVWKPQLHALGLPTGPWLTELRRLVREGVPDGTTLSIRWRDREGSRERVMTVGELKRQVLELTPGQKLCYVTDVAMTDDNVRRITALAAGADLLYIESAFLEVDADHARRKSHLTARFAGELAGRAGVREAVPFHFSTRYLDEGELLEQEFTAARDSATGALTSGGAGSTLAARSRA